MTDLTDIKGIGSTARKRLAKIGIETVEQLSESKTDNLMDVRGIGRKSAEKWISNAKELTDNHKEEKKTKKKKEDNTKQPVSRPIPQFLADRMSKKAKKVFDMSMTELKRSKTKKLKKYRRRLYPERIKYDPSVSNEKRMMDEIDKKHGLIEDIILDRRRKKGDGIFERCAEHFLNKEQVISLYPEFVDDTGVDTDNYSEQETIDRFAVWLFDNLPRKERKNYPFTDTNFIKRIAEKVKEYIAAQKDQK